MFFFLCLFPSRGGKACQPSKIISFHACQRCQQHYYSQQNLQLRQRVSKQVTTSSFIIFKHLSRLQWDWLGDKQRRPRFYLRNDEMRVNLRGNLPVRSESERPSCSQWLIYLLCKIIFKSNQWSSLWGNPGRLSPPSYFYFPSRCSSPAVPPRERYRSIS